MSSLLAFLDWFFLRAPKSQLIFAKNTTLLIEDAFGIITNLVYFFKPWYGDTSLVGRLLSLIIRTIMIITGAVAVFLVGIVLFTLPVVWVGSLVFIPWLPEITILPLIGAIYYFLVSIHQSEKVYAYISKPHDITEVMTGSTKEYLLLYPSPFFFTMLKDTQSLSLFGLKTQLPISELLMTVQAQSSTISITQLKSRLHECALTYKLRQIRPVHLFVALLYEHAERIKPILEEKNISMKQLPHFIEWDEYEYVRQRPPRPYESDFYTHTGGGTNRAHLGVVTPTLNTVSRDYTIDAAKNRHELRVVRPSVISQIEQILQKSENANVILRGEKGSGKEALIWQIAQLILVGELRNALWSKRIIGIDIPSLVAQGNLNGGTEGYIDKIRNEIKRSKNIVIYINDVQAAIEQAKAHGTNVLTMLEDVVQNNECSIIISCTPQEYSLLKEYNPRLLQIGETIDISEPSTEETLQIAHLHSLELESQYEVLIPYPILEKTIQYAQEYVHHIPFPQKALTLLEDTVIEASRTQDEKVRTARGLKQIISEKHIARTLTEKTHIPVGTITRKEADILLNLNGEMRKHIAAQERAIDAIVAVLQRNRAGVRTKTRPIGSFLFAGPTGVGKTHIAKTLAQLYFGTSESMIRLDMSEYQTNNDIHKLTSREAGSLVEHVRTTPFSLILLDEIEKAQPSVLDLFLQILDDARLTDEHGSVCDFTQTIIIATTNAGNQELYDLPHDHTYFSAATHILQKYFRTEFLNRFDDIITFEPLTTESIEKIIDLKVAALKEKLYTDKRVTLEITPKTKEWLTTFGYSPELGARNINRLIQDTIETKLAQKILSGDIKDGQTIVL